MKEFEWYNGVMIKAASLNNDRHFNTVKFFVSRLLLLLLMIFKLLHYRR